MIVISLLLSLIHLPVLSVPLRFQSWEDSLKIVHAPRARLSLLHKLADATRRENPQKAIGFCQEGLLLAHALKAHEEVLFLLNTQAKANRYLTYYDAAIALHKDAEAYEQHDLQQLARPETYLWMALAYKGKGQTTIALTYLQHAIQGFLQRDDPHFLGNSYHHLGRTYVQMGAYEQAMTAFEQALEIRLASSEITGAAYTLHNLGEVNQFVGDWTVAERYYEQAICLKDSLALFDLDSETLISRGTLFLQRGDIETARQFFQSALARAAIAQKSTSIIEAHAHLGRSYLLQQRLDSGISQLQQALLLSAPQKPTLAYAKTLAFWGELDVRQGREKSGLDSLNKAIAIFRQLHDRMGVEDICLRMKSHYLAQYDYQQALYWEESLSRFRDSLSAQEVEEQALARNLWQELDQKRHAFMQANAIEEKQQLTYMWVGNALLAAFLLAIGVVLAYRNRSQTKINQLLNTQNEQIAQANFSLRFANQEMEQFLHILSHELKTPIRNVGGYVSLLRSRYLSQLDHQGQQFVNFAMEGVRNMNQLLTDLMQYAQIGYHTPPPVGNVTLPQIVSRVVQDYGEEIQRLQAHVDVASLPDTALDYKSFYLVFRHLLDNALKFRREGVLPTVKIGYRQEGSRQLFWVMDNGIGIDAGHQEQIFHLFERLDPHGQRGGTGLGLAACRKIIRKHKGEIWVESTPGKGTTFFINLPDPNWRKEMTFDAHSGERWIAGTNL